MLFNQIIVPTDLSQNSFQAFDIATYQARGFNASLLLVHVLPSPASADEISLRTARLRELSTTHFHRQNVQPRVIHNSDTIAGTLVELVAREGASLIVIADRGEHCGLGLGSVASALVRITEVPLLIVPSGGQKQ